jgi:hypothetical protein
MPSPLPGRGKTEAPPHEDLNSVPPAAERSWPSDCASPSADTIQATHEPLAKLALSGSTGALDFARSEIISYAFWV